MKNILLTVWLLMPWTSSLGAEQPGGALHGWYREDGVKAEGAVVSSWENA